MRISLVKFELKEQNALLQRIAEALERLAPPIPERKDPQRAELSDLRIVDQQALQMLREVEDEFAKMTNTLPGSEAFEKAKREFEAEIRAGQGQQAVDQLPWNRIGKRG